MKTDVIIIGGGSTGVFTALDLAQRGIEVILVERGDLASGTTGKFHGMLHSGARYAVVDPESAKECIRENRILSKIAPHVIVDTGGIFAAITSNEEAYYPLLKKGLINNGIPYKELNIEGILKNEPYLNKKTKIAIEVPDKVIYSHDLIFSAALTASTYGAIFMPYHEVVGFIKKDNLIEGVKVKNVISNKVLNIKSEITVNATGPWADKLVKLAGIKVSVIPTAGVMGVLPKRINNHIFNRMRYPSDGDILVPYAYNISIMGTTATVIEDPDNFKVEEEDLQLLLEEGSEMFPIMRKMRFKRAYASVRPLLSIEGEEENIGRKASRTFKIFDHELNGIHGLLTISGGKLTTCRLMGEKISDIVADKLGNKARSKTAKTSLLGSKLEEDATKIAKITGLNEIFIRKLVSKLNTIDEERFLPALRLLMSYAFAEMRQ